MERGGKVRSFHIPRADKATVAKIVMDNIHHESRLHTDESRLYHGAGLFSLRNLRLRLFDAECFLARRVSAWLICYRTRYGRSHFFGFGCAARRDSPFFFGIAFRGVGGPVKAPDSIALRRSVIFLGPNWSDEFLRGISKL